MCRVRVRPWTRRNILLPAIDPMTTATATCLPRPSSRRGRPLRFASLPQASGRRVALLAVHHLQVEGRTLTGGAEKYIQIVLRALLDAGVTVHVGYSGTSIYNELLEQYDPRQLTVEQTGWIDGALSGDRRLGLSVIRHRRRWLRATGADTVFAVQQAGGGAFAASMLAAKSLGLRVVATLRQQPPPMPAPTGKRWWGLVPSPELWRRRLIWRYRLPACCCDALIYNSHRVAAAYHEDLGFSKRHAHVIYNGEVPADLPRHLARTDSPFDVRNSPFAQNVFENSPPLVKGRVREGFLQVNSQFNPPRSPLNEGGSKGSRTSQTHSPIVSAGRVTDAKGADVLLDAFAIVARRHPNCRLTYYGDGPLIPELKLRARAPGLAGRVFFPGYQADRDDVFADADICVQLSRRESMSNSVVEAMARGIPCVVSDVGGLPELVVDGESGYVVSANDPPACASAIGRLLDDDRRYVRFSEAAWNRARQMFDVHHVMRRTVRTILGLEDENVECRM